jgi:hypothetical protein
LREPQSNFLEHYHQERKHQGKDNLLLFPVSGPEAGSRGAINCRERLGGLLKYYSHAAQVLSPYGHGPATDISEPCRCSLSKVHSRGIQKSGRTTCEDLHEYHAGWRGGEFEQIHLLFSHVRPATERYLGT